MKHTITTLSKETSLYSNITYHNIVVNTSKNEIEKQLGIPANVNENDSKTKYEWHLELDNKIPFTIYDYDMDELGKEDIIEYHVGWESLNELDKDGYPTSLNGLYIVEALVEQGFAVSPSKAWQILHSK